MTIVSPSIVSWTTFRGSTLKCPSIGMRVPVRTRAIYVPRAAGIRQKRGYLADLAYSGRMAPTRSLLVTRSLPRGARGGGDLRTLQIVHGLTCAGPVGVFGLYPESRPPAAPPGVELWRATS